MEKTSRFLTRALAIALLLVTLLCTFTQASAASAKIGFTSHSNGQTVNPDENQKFTWNAVSGAKSYAYSVRDLTTDKKLINLEYTTSKNFTLKASKLVNKHTIRVWVAAYAGKNGTGTLISQATIELKLKAPEPIGFTSHKNGQTIKVNADQTFKWNTISDAKSYAYSVRDLTTDKKLIDKEYTTSRSFTLKGNKIVGGHKLRVWVAAYTGKNGSGKLISQATIEINVQKTGSVITAKRQKVLERANAWLNYSWTTKSEFKLWNTNVTIPKGTKVKGVPYSMLSMYNNLDSFKNLDKSKIVTKTGNVSGYGKRTGPAYGSDCVSLVADCWFYADNFIGTRGNKWDRISQAPGVKKLSDYSELKPGDALFIKQHAMLVIKIDNSKKEITVIEQTADGLSKSMIGTRSKTYTFSSLKKSGYVPYTYSKLG